MASTTRALLRGWLRGAVLPACALLLAAAVQAQTLDEVDVRTQGELKVVRIRFNASVGLLDISPASEANLYIVRFELLQADEAVQRQAVDEQRRVPAAQGLPTIIVGYRPDSTLRIKQLTVRLAQALPVQARQGPNARSIELLVRVAAPAAAASAPGASAIPALPVLGTPEVEAEAGKLMAQAREALANKEAEPAVAALNALLKLPPNSHSQQAQELIGNAWELAQSPERARVEYALYMKLYPQGEGAARVAPRLAALGGAPVAAAAGEAPAPKPEPPPLLAGSVAQYYYGGKAKSRSLVNIATGIDQATLSRTTESAIVTSVDLSGRYVGGGGDTRAVVRGSGSTNLLSGGHSSNSVSAAYVEHRRGTGGEGLAVRVGRQSPISGGLLGLFNGISLAMPLAEGLKFDLMGGTPASALVSAPSEKLFAAVLEADSFLERFGGNFYVLDQSTQGITNRRAVGTELRYAGDAWSLNTLLDYDAVFAKMNAVSVHASVQAGAQTTVTVLVDQRRAPSLQLTNALISSGADSLQTLLQTKTLDEVKADALATSATARQFLLSVARPLSPQWQFSTDLRYSAVGALPAVGDFQATPATGGQYGWGLQLTGTNLYSKRDVNNFNLNVISTPFFKGVQLAYNNLTGLAAKEGQELTLEPSLRFYTQKDDLDVKLSRLGLGTRLSWRASRRASLLGEVLYETSRTNGPTNSDRSNSAFFYVGYRYELF